MIEKTNSFKVGEKCFLTLLEAQTYELTELAKLLPDAEPVVKWVLENRVKLLDILTTTNRSKPRARKINGGTKVRKVDFAPLGGVKEIVKISLPPKPVISVPLPLKSAPVVVDPDYVTNPTVVTTNTVS